MIILGALSAKQRVANPSVKAVALRCLISWLHDLSLSKTVSSRLGHVCSKQAVHVQVLYTVSQCSEPLCGVIHSDFGAGTVYLKHRHAGPVRCRRRWCTCHFWTKYLPQRSNHTDPNVSARLSLRYVGISVCEASVVRFTQDACYGSIGVPC